MSLKKTCTFIFPKVLVIENTLLANFRTLSPDSNSWLGFTPGTFKWNIFSLSQNLSVEISKRIFKLARETVNSLKAGSASFISVALKYGWLFFKCLLVELK